MKNAKKLNKKHQNKLKTEGTTRCPIVYHLKSADVKTPTATLVSDKRQLNMKDLSSFVSQHINEHASKFSTHPLEIQIEHPFSLDLSIIDTPGTKKKKKNVKTKKTLSKHKHLKLQKQILFKGLPTKDDPDYQAIEHFLRDFLRPMNRFVICVIESEQHTWDKSRHIENIVKTVDAHGVRSAFVYNKMNTLV